MGRVRWGDEGYAREELVAEIGSAFLCSSLEITPEVREDHAGYLASWLKVLKSDRRAIFAAAAQAQKFEALNAGSNFHHARAIELQTSGGAIWTRGRKRNIAIGQRPVWNLDGRHLHAFTTAYGWRPRQRLDTETGRSRRINSAFRRSSAVGAIASDGGTLFGFATQLPADGYGCDYHPSVTTHSRMGGQLATALSAILGW